MHAASVEANRDDMRERTLITGGSCLRCAMLARRTAATTSSLSVLLVVASATACWDLPIPPGARIGCVDDEECPEGFECREALGLCVELRPDDAVAPTIASSSIDPAVARIGTTVTARFETNEPLLQSPVVSLVGAAGPRLFDVVTADADGEGRRYTASIVVNAADGDGAHDIRAQLIDVVGNVADDALLGRIDNDFTAPVVAELLVAPAAANADVDVVVTVRTDEPIADASTVALVPVADEAVRVFSLDAVGADPLVRTFRLRTDAAVDVEGDRAVTATVVDNAGNSVDKTSSDLRLDFTAPAIVGDASIGRAVVTAGQVATIALQADEAVTAAVVSLVPVDGDGDDIIDGVPLSLTLDARAGRDLQLRREIDATDAEGRYRVAVDRLVDLAGNVALDLAVSETIVIDQGAPVFSEVPTSSPSVLSRRAGNDIVTVAFALNEAADVTVQIGPTTVPCSSDDSVSGIVRYTCVRGVADGDVDGIFGVTVTAIDAAGNAAFATAPSITADFTAPIVALSVVPARQARGGEVISLAAVADEALDPARFVLTSSLAFSAPVASGRSATSTFTVPPGTEGSFPVSVVAADLGGNTAAPVEIVVVIDGVSPTLVSSSLSSPRVAPDEAFSFSLQASEPLSADPTVTFTNGDVVGGLPVVATMTRTSGPDAEQRYVYAGRGPTTGQNQFYTVTVVMQDLAGNPGADSPAVLVVDNAAPRLAGFDIAPAAARAGDVVRVVVTADETLSAPPIVVAENGAQRLTFVPTDTAGGALSYVFTSTISAATPQGTWTFQPVTLVDQAGNSGTVTPPGPRTFSVDSVSPTITAVTVTPRAAKAGTDVRVSFTTSEPIAAPDVLIDDLLLTQESASNGNRGFVFVRRIVGTEGEGLAPITISVADAAGNVGIAGDTVALDFDAPGLISATASPAVARANSRLVYTVTADETLAAAPILTVGGGVVPFVLQAGSTFIYTADITNQPNGARTVQVGLTDVAGNTATVAGGGFSIDATVPTFSAFTTTPRVSAVVGRNVVTTTFTLSENVGAGLDVKVGGRAASCTNAGLSFTCTLTAVLGDGEGAKSVTAQATDAAGNLGVVSGVVDFDFTSPVLLASAVRLQGAANNPLPTVTAAKVGTVVELTATLNERIAAPTLVTAPVFGTFAVTDTNPTFVFRTTVSGAVNGDATVSFVATDLAGNATTVTLPTVPLDNVAPAAPAVAVADRIVFTRAPWGTNAAPASTFRLDGVASSVESNAVVAAYAGASLSSGEIARTVASGAGAFTLPLNIADRPDVFVAAIDAAGNASSVVRVRDVRWTATMRDKVVGSTVENPHTFEARANSERAREQANAVERPQNVATTDGLVDEVIAVPSFVEVSGDTSTGTIAFDPYRDVALMPGGRTGMLEWDGTRWTAVRVQDPENDGRPDFGRPFETVYDLERAELVLFGGLEDDETWIYDGISWRLADVASLLPRTLFALAWDDAARQVTLFGGSETVAQGDGCVSAQFQCLADTLVWTGGEWIEIDDNGGPAAREGAAMTWDPTRGSLVLFGGANEDSGDFNDTWLWDGGWTRLTTTGTPPARARSRLAFHDTLAGTVMHGGQGANIDLATMFVLRGSAWTTLDVGAAVAPPATSNHDLEYDPARDQLLLVTSDETWLRTSTGWRRANAGVDPVAGAPQARDDAAMAYDPVRQRTMLFGGAATQNITSTVCDGGFGRCGDSWEFDGARWTQRSLSGTSPGRRSGAGLVIDEPTGNAYLYGGSTSASPCDQSASNFCDGIYRITGAGVSARLSPAVRPPPRTDAAVVFDPVLRRVIVHGGNNNGTVLSDTWAYTIATNVWTQVCTSVACIATSPGPRREHTMTWDTDRNVGVLFGGSFGNGTESIIYEFTPGTNTWTRRVQNGDIPEGRRFDPGLSYDPERRRTVMFGRLGGANDPCGTANECGDLFEFNNATGVWTRIDVVNSAVGDLRPSRRNGVAMVYDPIRREHQIAGGSDILDFETWRYISSAASRPGQMFVVDFDAARAGASTLRSVSVSWRAQGSLGGFALTSAVDGRRVTLGTTNSIALTTVTSTSVNPAALLTPTSDFVFWADARTAALNGTSASALATDAVEATVVYRLP